MPVEPGYGYHFFNWEKTYEYNSNIRDILRGDEDIRKWAIEQLVIDWDYLIQKFTKYKFELQSPGIDNFSLKEKLDRSNWWIF